MAIPFFMQVVNDLEKEEGIKLDTFEYGKKRSALVIPTIEVVTERIAAYEIAIPLITPRVERKKAARQVIEELNMDAVRLGNPLKLNAKEPPKTFTYEGRDVITDDVVVQRTYAMPQAKTSGEIIAFYAQIIAQSLKLPAQFSVLAPKIEQFLREKAYGQPVDLNSPNLLVDLNRSQVLIFTEKVFLKLLRPLLTEEKQPVVSGAEMYLSRVAPFPWSGKIAECRHTLYNVTPVGNDFEQEFANFLDSAPEIAAFANLGNLKPNLSIEYLDGEANLRQYEPDFVARTTEGDYWLLETKGREDADVQRKDERAIKWCADVSTLTGQTWRYLKIPDKEFKKLKPASFDELVSALEAGGPLFM